ncbi:glycosyltransferase family 2 protein [Marinobacterium mangrovicola]|uniref:GT2 family glycosyltransferase n=1 Tax=Marinobacterium mangrovicola TaxID=1476959 RepID=A0A4R1GK31_9GAMM|nr:glycosyltransferase family 2 protein [Marinobacterium mangrovicola]TCK07543.1 GT2 family glycosyltransferase [Marinobacterium mangrovicola]
MTLNNQHQLAIAIIIVGYRNPDDIINCLTSLSESSYTNYEVFIIENGGYDSFVSLQERLKAFSAGAQVIHLVNAGQNGGFAAGVNMGIKEANGFDAWWVLNPDTRPEPDALKALVYKLTVSNYDAVGGVLLKSDGKIQSLGGYWSIYSIRPISIGNGFSIDTHIDERKVESKMNYITGASILISKKFVETVGLMREDYFLYCEEIEWCIRALNQGMKIGFSKNSIVHHIQGTTTGSGAAPKSRSKLSIFLDERNKILMMSDLNHKFAKIFLSPLALSLIFFRYFVKGNINSFKIALSGWYSGIINKRGKPSFIGED